MPIAPSPILTGGEAAETAAHHEEMLLLYSSAATVLTIGMFASGIPTCLDVARKNDATGVSYATWLTQLANCVLWLKYGILTDNSTVQLVNGFGCVMDVLYLSIVYMYTKSSTARGHLFGPYVGTMLTIITALVYIQYMLTEKDSAISVAGVLAAGFSMVMFATPLLGALEVIKAKSTAGMQFGQSVVFFLCSASWTGFGYMLQDNFILVPNGVGCGFASLQLLLFLLYPAPRKQAYTTGIVRD